MFRIVDHLRTWAPLRWGGVTEEGKPVTNELQVQLRLGDVDANVALMADATEAVRATLVTDQAVRRALFDRLIGQVAGAAARVDEARADAGAGAEPAGPVSQSQLFAALSLRIVGDHRGLGDDKGRELPFTWSSLRQLMAVPGTFDALLAAYGKAARGTEGIREGN